MARRGNAKRQYPRMARVNEMLRSVLAAEVQAIDDDRLVDVSITNVVCESDLARAVVYFDVLDGAESDERVVETFDELRHRLQAAVNRDTHLKATPVLSFEADPVLRSAERIDSVLRALKDHQPSDDAP